jgi:hypothetical protein
VLVDVCVLSWKAEPPTPLPPRFFRVEGCVYGFEWSFLEGFVGSVFHFACCFVVLCVRVARFL